MKKLKLFYNSFSGDRQFKNYLDDCVKVFHRAGYETHLFRTMERGDIAENIRETDRDYYDAIVLSGGDGTINIGLNALIESGFTAPIGIIPSGTANDFATFLKLPKDAKKAAEVIAEGNIVDADIGCVNGKFFINVCAWGLLTDISQKVDENLKNTLGKLAYYLKGLEQIPEFKPIPVRITTTQNTFEQDIYLFIVLNSGGTGGFERIVPNASINDGMFEFVAIKACPLVELAKVFVNLFRGEIINDPNVIHFQDRYIKIESLGDSKDFEHADVDGEQGPALPLEIRNIHKAVKFFMPRGMRLEN